MSKRNNKMTVGELQAILNRTEVQRDNTLYLLDKAKKVIKEQDKIIQKIRQKSIKNKIISWVKRKWSK